MYYCSFYLLNDDFIEIWRKQLLKEKKKVSYSLVLGLNVIVTYFLLRFFGGEKIYVKTVLVGLVLFFILLKTLYFNWYVKLLLMLHLLFAGLVMLSFPMGMVFAVIGSYFLAFQIAVTIYLPILLLVFLNSYFLFGSRLFLKSKVATRLNKKHENR